MQVYTVHYLPTAPDPDRKATFLREGFSWPAFLFTGLWALWNRLWIPAIVIIAVSVAIELLVSFVAPDPLTAFAVTIGFSWFIGLHANDWRRGRLERQGYRFAGVIAAPNADAAVRRFFDLHPEVAADGSHPGVPRAI